MSSTERKVPSAREAVTSSRLYLTLTADGKIAVESILRDYEKETIKAKVLTCNTTLTTDVYKRAHDGFKLLTRFPFNNGEPIYIMPELDEKGELQPLLKEIVTGILTRKSYHEFITKSWGETWVLLLRLHLGLESKGYKGFRISIEEFHSMMASCYWRAIGLKTTNLALVEKDGKTLTKAGNLLVANAMFPPEDSTKISQFLNAVAKIPRAGERDMLAVSLDDTDYYRVAMMGMISYIDRTKLPAIQKAGLILHDGIANAKKDPYSQAKTEKFAAISGANMFWTILNAGFRYHRIFFIDRRPFILFPSQTMLTIYYQILNPGRNLEVLRRLGIFDPLVMEDDSDHNRRSESLFAPGVTNPIIAHSRPGHPCFNLMHDEYHAAFEALLTLASYLQMKLANHIIKRFHPEMNTERFRSIDRERSPELDEKTRFFELIKYLFAFSVIDFNSKLHLGSVILLVNMILSPEHWAFYPELKEKLINLLLPCNGKKPADYVAYVERSIKKYAEYTKQHDLFTPILVLAHFYLDDLQFCKAIVDALKQNLDISSLYAWRKEEHGHLYPVFVFNGVDYKLEKLVTMEKTKRLELLQSSILAITKATSTAEAKRTLITASIDEKQRPAEHAPLASVFEADTNMHRLFGRKSKKVPMYGQGCKLRSGPVNLGTFNKGVRY